MQAGQWGESGGIPGKYVEEGPFLSLPRALKLVTLLLLVSARMLPPIT